MSLVTGLFDVDLKEQHIDSFVGCFVFVFDIDDRLFVRVVVGAGCIHVDASFLDSFGHQSTTITLAIGKISSINTLYSPMYVASMKMIV